jgi:thiol-disulfide isomerase/thioredoxin
LSCFAAVFATRAADVPTLAIGSPAPDFSLPGVDGKTYSLKDFAAAKVLLVAFTSNHCPEAQAYEDRLIKLTNDYKDKGVAVVAINPNSPKGVRLDELGYTDLDDTFASMKIRAEYKKFNFPYLDDGETQTALHLALLVRRSAGR